MKRKLISDFTKEETKWMDTVVVNFMLAQSDGFQLGYAQALCDFTENIIDYWQGSDDKPQQSVLNVLVDLGVELRKRQETVMKNIKSAKKQGYERHYNWEYKEKDSQFSQFVGLYTKEFDTNRESEDDKCPG